MQYDRLDLYFMTGTGNTRRAALFMADEAEATGVPATAHAISGVKPMEPPPAGPTGLLGLLMPTHGFTAPWLMMKFAARLPRGEGRHAFCVTTRGGLKFGRLFTPGIGGTAVFLIALMLFVKGYRVRGALGLDMPSNWTSLHSGLKEETSRPIIARAEKRSKRFAGTLLAGKLSWFTWSNLYDLVFGLLLLPVSLGYLVVGRLALAKLFFATNECNSCGICEANCPVAGVKLRGTRRPLPYWTYHCESCMRCMAYCPKQAIEASQSYGAVVVVLCTLPAVAYALERLAAWWPQLAALNGPAGLQVFGIAWAILVVAVSYVFFYLLSRIPPINTLFKYTTLTVIYKRYKEPDTKLSHLKSGK